MGRAHEKFIARIEQRYNRLGPEREATREGSPPSLHPFWFIKKKNKQTPIDTNAAFYVTAMFRDAKQSNSL